MHDLIGALLEGLAAAGDPGTGHSGGWWHLLGYLLLIVTAVAVIVLYIMYR